MRGEGETQENKQPTCWHWNWGAAGEISGLGSSDHQWGAHLKKKGGGSYLDRIIGKLDKPRLAGKPTKGGWENEQKGNCKREGPNRYKGLVSSKKKSKIQSYCKSGTVPADF